MQTGMKTKDLFAITAHEIKTPLTTLKLVIQLYLQRYYENGPTVVKLEDLKAMDAEVNRLTALVNDLLDASTMENGKLNLSLQIVDLTTLIKENVERMKLYSREHTIVVNGGKPLVDKLNVVADPNRLTQVLVNLLTNATKYSPPQTTIKVNTKQHKNKVVVSIQNEGEAIPTDKQAHVFERFFQTDGGSKQGMGLGLYITKEIIEGMKGKIWLESRPDEGNVFSFSLPFHGQLFN